MRPISTLSASNQAPLGAPPPTRRLLPSSLAGWLSTAPFIGVHLACLAVVFTGVNVFDVSLCVFLYFIRMFGITAGYHRYFAHHSYKTSRPFQFVLALLGSLSWQKGPLWWAAHHRQHHKYSDTENDVHSPHTNGFWWSHVGWIITDQFDATNWKAIRDFAHYPELRWLNYLHWVPGVFLALFAWLAGGWWRSLQGYALGNETELVFSFPDAWSALVVGFFISTVILYHAVFSVNSLCHVFGQRRYATGDLSRNNPWVALLTLGEGWHNNHHHYQSSANQGFFWWELDVSYYIIKALEAGGIVWNVRQPPPHRLKIES